MRLVTQGRRREMWTTAIVFVINILGLFDFINYVHVLL